MDSHGGQYKRKKKLENSRNVMIKLTGNPGVGGSQKINFKKIGGYNSYDK